MLQPLLLPHGTIYSSRRTVSGIHIPWTSVRMSTSLCPDFLPLFVTFSTFITYGCCSSSTRQCQLFDFLSFSTRKSEKVQKILDNFLMASPPPTMCAMKGITDFLGSSFFGGSHLQCPSLVIDIKFACLVGI